MIQFPAKYSVSGASICLVDTATLHVLQDRDDPQETGESTLDRKRSKNTILFAPRRNCDPKMTGRLSTRFHPAAISKQVDEFIGMLAAVSRSRGTHRVHKGNAATTREGYQAIALGLSANLRFRFTIKIEQKALQP
jgi:hypothetical protein